MSTRDQLSYLLSRERHQRDLRTRATMAETIAFHDRLASHYQRLAGEVRATMALPPIP